MTDKQIIIDGVDVSKGNQKYADKNSPVYDLYKAEVNTVDGINLAECVHFTRQFDYGYCELSNDSCNEFQYNCVKNKNCYYKQLKRKEQECEELRTDIKDIANLLDLDTGEEYNFGNIELEIKELKAENDELKKTIDDLLHKPEVQDKILWKIDNEALLGSKNAYIYKLEKTLTEIKEIAEANKKYIYVLPNYSVAGDSLEFSFEFTKQILQKINEVENDL